MNKLLKLDAARLRVPLGLAIGLSAILFLGPCRRDFLWAGVVVAFAGLLIRAWAAGCIKKSKILSTSGPYGLVRHPLYLGSALIAIGFSLSVTSPENLALSVLSWGVVVIYFILVYSHTVKKEERHLAEKFGLEWTAYKERTPSFLPYNLSCFKSISPNSFSFAQYMKNREYEAAIGWIGISFLFFIILPAIRK